ncbi:MAG: hypothetical protein PQJ46_06820 [Spirochaetales bacterium]|nr:hypothetical protein [Spirochaetales bacterium]
MLKKNLLIIFYLFFLSSAVFSQIVTDDTILKYADYTFDNDFLSSYTDSAEIFRDLRGLQGALFPVLL